MAQDGGKVVRSRCWEKIRRYENHDVTHKLEGSAVGDPPVVSASFGDVALPLGAGQVDWRTVFVLSGIRSPPVMHRVHSFGSDGSTVPFIYLGLNVPRVCLLSLGKFSVQIPITAGVSL